MSAKHTPGPWTTDGSRIFRQVNPGGRKEFVAEIVGNQLSAQRQKNANLIAAAPELRRELDGALSFIVAHGRLEPGTEAMERQIRIRALLARIDGDGWLSSTARLRSALVN